MLYKRNYLTNVVIRADFASIVPDLEKGITGDLAKKILKSFPIAEPQQVREGSLKINQKEVVSGPTRQFTIWNYFGKEREKVLTVGNDYLSIEYKKNFKTFTTLRQEFLSVIETFFLQNQTTQCKRFGLRFINQIELDETNPIDWTKYISKNLLSIFNVPLNDYKLSRAFQILGLKKDDMDITFQYGIHNPDYPAVIKKKLFILDLDAYSQGIITETEIKSKIDTFYESIKSYFENSITEELRKKMRHV